MSSPHDTEMTVRQITFREAIREALREEMKRDQRVFLMGEDIGAYGGAYKVTEGLLEEFGPDRVIDTPISESAIVGAGVGAAMMGQRPVVEIMFVDIIPVCMDQLVNSMAKIGYVHDGKLSAPMVVRTAFGGMHGRKGGVYDNQSFEAWFMHVPGLKVVMPSEPADAKGLLKAAIRDPDPVIFFEHKYLYGNTGPVPDGEYLVELGQADVKRPGNDVTVVALGAMVGHAQKAAAILAKRGIDLEIIDPRTLVPLDKETIVASVQKTGKLIVVHEAVRTCGAGAEIAAIVAAEAFGYLEAPVERIANPGTPVPFSIPLAARILPDESDIITAVERLMAYG